MITGINAGAGQPGVAETSARLIRGDRRGTTADADGKVVQGCTKQGTGFDFDARRWRGWELRPLGGRRSRAKPSAARKAELRDRLPARARPVGRPGRGAPGSPGPGSPPAAAISCWRPALLESPGRVDRVGPGRGDAAAKRCAGTERAESRNREETRRRFLN